MKPAAVEKPPLGEKHGSGQESGPLFRRNPTNDFFSPLTLEHLYEVASQSCGLHQGVPEDIRDYFHVVVTLYLYGWLYYPFYTLASERSLFAVEMALRKRFPPQKLDKKGRDRRSLGDLLKEATDAGLLRDEGFPSLENRHTDAEELNQNMAEILGGPGASAESSLCGRADWDVPFLRNHFAHPNMQTILTPGQALDGLIQGAEIINQLWPMPRAVSSDGGDSPPAHT